LCATVIACLYLPNGIPQPGPKFDYKLAWFDRLIAHARKLFAEGVGITSETAGRGTLDCESTGFCSAPI